MIKRLILVLALCLAATTAQASSFLFTGAGSTQPCKAIAPPSGGIFDSTSLVGYSTSNVTLTTTNRESLNCDTLASSEQEDSTNSQHQLFFDVSHAWIAGTHTLTFYAARLPVGNPRNVFVEFFSSGFSSVFLGTISLATCQYTSGPSVGGVWSAPTGTTQFLANYCKITIGGTTTVDTSFRTSFYLDNGATNAYLGDGVSGVSLWGVDLR